MSALHAELINGAMSDREDPEAYFLRMEELQRQLKELGVTVEEATLKGIAAAKMPARYGPLRAVLDTMKDLKYDDFKQHVRAYYIRNIKGARVETDEDAALITTENGHYRGKPKCQECGKLGHIKKYCWQLNGGGDGRKCWECGQPGHLAKNCPSKSEKCNMAIEL